MQITHPIFWIIFVSLIFWAFYERFDSHRKTYIDHPKWTIIYFLSASVALIVIQPFVLKFLTPNLLSVFAVILAVFFTYFAYKILAFFFIPPHKTFEETHHYHLLLNPKYILPKLAEVIFQQTFFGTIMSVFILDNLAPMHIFAICSLGFVVAHIPLLLLQGKKIGIYFLIWSAIGAPLFAFVLLKTHSLWYTISLHFLFYTFLSILEWCQSGKKFPWLFDKHNN